MVIAARPPATVDTKAAKLEAWALMAFAAVAMLVLARATLAVSAWADCCPVNASMADCNSDAASAVYAFAAVVVMGPVAFATELSTYTVLAVVVIWPCKIVTAACVLVRLPDTVVSVDTVLVNVAAVAFARTCTAVSWADTSVVTLAVASSAHFPVIGSSVIVELVADSCHVMRFCRSKSASVAWSEAFAALVALLAFAADSNGILPMAARTGAEVSVVMGAARVAES